LLSRPHCIEGYAISLKVPLPRTDGPLRGVDE